jgi:hypothetical protein
MPGTPSAGERIGFRPSSLLQRAAVALGLLALALPATADIIPPDRLTTWNPGLNAVGGIPFRTTIYRTISPSGGDDTAAVQTALDNCPANQVVKLGPGTFRISGSGLEIRRSNVVLRGSGPTRTRLVKAAGTNFPVIIIGQRWYKWAQQTAFTSDAVKETNTVTLASNPGLSVGELVHVDETYDSSLVYYNPATQNGDYQGWGEGRLGPQAQSRPLGQAMEIASINGNVVTFTTNFHISFRTSHAAHLARISNGSAVVPAVKWSGIEDLYVSQGEGDGNIIVFASAYCWVRNLESDASNGSSVAFDGTFRCELRDSFVHSTVNPNPGGGGYGIVVDSYAADNLIENNISSNFNKVMVMRSSGGGNVIGYNYMDDAYGAGYATIVEVGLNASHMAGCHYELFEGNQAFNYDSDSYWGSQLYMTVFRNHLTTLRRSLPGVVVPLTDAHNRRGVGLTINQWWHSFVGNVIGYPSGYLQDPSPFSPLIQGAIFKYEWLGGRFGDDGGYTPIWQLGYDGSNWLTTQDTLVQQRTLRDGNYDFFTNAVRWHGIGGTGTGTVPSPIPTIRASLYLTGKPAFFGSNPWPWVDPLGTTKLYSLPARSRFDAGTPNLDTTLTVAKAGAGSGTVTSSPAGINCGASCSASYTAGTVVTLTAAPAAGSTFSGWGGVCSGTGSCQVTIDGATYATATFDSGAVNYTLTVAKAGPGSGTVNSSPAGVNCGATCSASYAADTLVTLTAAPAAGSTFSGWSGACSGTGACQVTMSAAMSVTASFTFDPLLTVAKSGTGLGTVTSSPAGIDCGATCSAGYATGAVVTLTAAPSAESAFSGWTGACSGTGSCVVTMSAALSVKANFTLSPVPYMLTAAKTGAGSGTLTSSPPAINCGAMCSASYTAGTVVTLAAAPAASSTFAGWSGACSGTGSCVVTMSAARSVTANFALSPVSYVLTAAKSGTGSGTVTSSPAAIDCGATCSASYTAGTVVTLAAAPAAGSAFAGWSGACSGTGSCVVTMSAARSVTATFGPVYSLTVAKAGTGGGKVVSAPAGVYCGSVCSANYVAGTVVTLAATPAAGSTFAGWSGACSGTGSCALTIGGTQSVTATFTALYRLTVTKAGIGGGTVTSSPAGINCGAACGGRYTSGTLVTLDAAPAAGSTFTGWTGACSGTGSCPLTMSAAASVTATFDAPTRFGLVAAWSFDDGAGTTARDSSPNGNTGTLLNGPTWTTGRYGGALLFNGANTLVRVNDSNSLDLTTAATFEAWVYPTVAATVGWRTILQKEVDAYFFTASGGDSGDKPASGGTLDGYCCSFVVSPSALAANTWTHLAATYDGWRLRLYVNGVLVRILVATGSFQVNANPLWIGGNAFYGEYFTGKLDELRIYNRALTQAEIQQDLVTPLP